ncbi:MAG: threonine/serine dehydratase [Acidimicrobiia bacterium]|nr:threonine/serine dehydratase [Acidimicrobiia bacterium]
MEPSPEAIARVTKLIRPHVRRTPLLTLAPDDLGLTGGQLALKLELAQHSGSFKARGAFANLLLRAVPPVGVAAASGGNHGAAVAYAAKRLGHRATIFVPSVASPAKLNRIRRDGAELVVGGDRYADALAACDAFVAKTGALSIHAYDSPETLLGTGTLAQELEEQCAALDTVLVAVGGGGLIGGIAAWYRGRVKVVGVEPFAAPTLAYARAAGHPVDAPAGGIAADSLAPRQVGQLMFPLAQAFVNDVVLVEDEEIHQARVLLWDSLRIAAEPGGAAALAALVSRRFRTAPGERVGVIVCGGNADPPAIAECPAAGT